MLEELGGPYLPAVGPVAALSEEDRDALSSYGDFHLARHGDVLIPQGESHRKLTIEQAFPLASKLEIYSRLPREGGMCGVTKYEHCGRQDTW